MKIRTDFVTNSSSSSFVCFGVSVDEVKIAKEAYLELFKEFIKENPDELSEDEINEMNDDEKVEYITDNCDDYELFNSEILTRGGPSDCRYVGITPRTYIDKFPDSTFKDTKKIAAEELNKRFNTNFTEKDIEYFEEGWYD